MDEEDLDLNALQQKDPAAFKTLISRLHPLLLSLVRPMVGDGPAEEIVQEAWIKVYNSIGRFEGRSQLKTWISSIALNEARMYLRRNKKEFSMTESAGDGGILDGRFRENGGWSAPPVKWRSAATDDLLMQDNLIECIERTMNRLPVNQSSLLRLRDMEGLPFEMICNELEVTASNARVLLHRARGELYQMLEHYEETGEC